MSIIDTHADLVRRTRVLPATGRGQTARAWSLLVSVLGIASEAGEVADLLKKHAEGKAPELDTERLVEELGDVAWYVHNTALLLGVDLHTVLVENIEKLDPPVAHTEVTK